MNTVKSVKFVKESKYKPYKPVIVYATMTDGTVKRIFAFFEDLMSFTESELIGLTAEQAFKLFINKDFINKD